MTKPIPKRGEIWFALLDKKRPVIVIQNDIITEFIQKQRLPLDIMAVPLTGKVNRWKNCTTSIFIKKDNINNLDFDDIAKCHQVSTIQYKNYKYKIGCISEYQLAEIEKKVLWALNL
ncbi:MAG: type II toxin-antitoxin system PemK/MazF family toxin [Candidatus Cloacimonadota bacterium]|nr:MAG: type II toxin-antitoxin system PemK/MazF family toxin [Candidatus Cloacimonadota bacterium]